MNRQEQEEREFTHTSDAEWDKDQAREMGERSPSSPWILSDRDVWYVNPSWGKFDKWGNPLDKKYPYKNCIHPEDWGEDDQ